MGNISSKANIFWTKIADSNFLSIESYHIVKHMLKHLLGKIKCLSASGCQLSDGSPRVAPLTWSISWDASLALEVTQFSCHLRQVENLSCCTHLYFIAAPCPIAVLFFFFPPEPSHPHFLYDWHLDEPCKHCYLFCISVLQSSPAELLVGPTADIRR